LSGLYTSRIRNLFAEDLVLFFDILIDLHRSFYSQSAGEKSKKENDSLIMKMMKAEVKGGSK